MTKREPFRDEENNRTINVKNGALGQHVIYRDYLIREKQDFGEYGFLISGFRVKTGYVVIKDGCNVMPGACWFQTVEAAMRAIDDLIESEKGTIVNSGRESPFWTLNRFRRHAEERAPELALLLQELVDASVALAHAPTVESHDRLMLAHVNASKMLDQIDWNCDMRTTVQQVADPSSHRDGSMTGRFAAHKVGERTFGRFGGILPFRLT